MATVHYADRRHSKRLCGRCCGWRCMAAVDTLLGETYALEEIPEGKHALEVAKAYGIEGAK